MNGPISESAVFAVNSDVLTLSIAGQGTVSPNYNGQSLPIGKHFQITAKPAPGFLLSNWVGGVFPDLVVITNSAKLNFAMRSNLTLQANFVPNPFTPLKGAYTGLFAESGVPHHVSSGSLSLSLTDRGSCSGTVFIGGTRFSISGQFDLSGHASQSISSGTYNINLALDMTSGANAMTGTVTAGSWTSDLQAFRAVFDTRTNPASAFASKYTLVIPGVLGDASSPAGDSVATLTVDAGGKLNLTGTLADGTAFRQTAPISDEGAFPLYVPLYAGKGSLSGWLSITNRDSDDLHGQVAWTRPPLATAKVYAPGFTNLDLSAVGSIYHPPASGTRFLNLPTASVSFSGGNLSSPFTNAVTLAANNKCTSSKNLSLTASSANGQLAGAATPPAFSRAYPLKAVVLQKQNLARGFLLLTNQSSAFLLSP
jgi:hypothetical protein